MHGTGWLLLIETLLMSIMLLEKQTGQYSDKNRKI